MTGTATFAEIGLGATRTVVEDEPQTLVLPADGGVVPTRVTGTVTRRQGTDRAVLTLRAGGRITRLVLGAGRRQARFDVALGPRDRGEAFVELGLAATSPDDVRCDERAAVELTGAAVRFDRAAPPPLTVAEALPGVLRRLRVVVPDPATDEEVTAAVKLAAALVARYAGQHVRLLVGADRARLAADSDPFGATVEVGDGSAIAVRREDGAPVIAVGAAAADRAVERLRLFSRTEQASGLPLRAPAELAGTVTTLSDVGARDLRARGLGELTLTVPFSQSDLGAPVRGASLQLRGTVSAIATGASAVLEIALNDRVLGSWDLGRGGAWRHDVDVPGGLLARDNTLRVSLTHALAGGGCGEVPVTLTVDPQSTVTADLGLGSVVGLGDVPQALLPVAGLAMTDRTTVSVAAAVQVAGLLQRLSRRPLAFRTMSVDSALRGREPAIVVGARAPLPDVEPGSIGALTASRVGDRLLLSAGHRGAPGLLGRLLAALAARDDGLASAGRAAAAVQTPTALRLIPARAEAVPADRGSGGLPGAVIIGGVAVLIGLLGLGAYLFHRSYW